MDLNDGVTYQETVIFKEDIKLESNEPQNEEKIFVEIGSQNLNSEYVPPKKKAMKGAKDSSKVFSNKINCFFNHIISYSCNSPLKAVTPSF